METKQELNAKILALSAAIQEKYPELYKNLDEMPVPDSKTGSEEISIKVLKAYYESLHSTMRNYIREHDNPAKNLAEKPLIFNLFPRLRLFSKPNSGYLGFSALIVTCIFIWYLFGR